MSTCSTQWHCVPSSEETIAALVGDDISSSPLQRALAHAMLVWTEQSKNPQLVTRPEPPPGVAKNIELCEQIAAEIARV